MRPATLHGNLTVKRERELFLPEFLIEKMYH
jgi:hypothetical protein